MATRHRVLSRDRALSMIGGLQEFASRSAAGTASLVLWSPSTARGIRPFRDIMIRTLRCAQNAS